MDDMKSSEPGKGTSFKRVTKCFNTASGSRRGEAKMTVSTTGAIRSNAEGKDLVGAFIKSQGLDPNNYQLGFGGNEDLGQLALYAPKPGDEGLMKVSMYKNAISFHAGAAFKESPRLRPSTKVECFVEPDTDADGEPCLVVHVGGGTPTRTVKRGSASGDGNEE
jgi:hypothetical protein